MRKFSIMILVLGIGAFIGYVYGHHMASKEYEYANSRYYLHEAVGNVSICGNNLHYANPDASSQAAKYSIGLYEINANQAIELMNAHVPFFLPITDQIEGITRGRDYMLRNGFVDQASKADALLAALAKNAKKEIK